MRELFLALLIALGLSGSAGTGGVTAPAEGRPSAAAPFGRSAEGRPLRVRRVGDPAAPVRVLVVGSIHGNETAGHAVVARLRRTPPPAGVQLWLVRTANPDGVAAGTRQNARGVDLNRNFPFRWAGGGRPFDTYFPGSSAASEPETRALRRLAARRPPRPDRLLPPADAAGRAPARRADARRCASTRAARACRPAGCPPTAAPR